MENFVKVLQERGFIEQTTDEEALVKLFSEEIVTAYIGFDPTASSLHVGHLVPIMSLAHMQRLGHKPLALVGGGTGMIGDPSGRDELRKMMTLETIAENVAGLKRQLSNFLDFSDGRAEMGNNADWLPQLGYIEFLRDIGKHFSVNRMIKFEGYKMRMASEEGLNFIEFNYMLLQAYDFLKLYQTKGCKLQMGGSDQWGNIVAGIDLTRRVEQAAVHGITFKLITTASGAKMGKTAQGAIWLDAARTSPYDYYQFWVNTDDNDVQKFLALFTFLPMAEINAVAGLNGAELNMAKAVLAFEATTLAHGEAEALKAYQAAADLFGARQIPAGLLASSKIPREGVAAGSASVPSSNLAKAELEAGVPMFKLMVNADLAKSNGAARRLIEQGGAYLNGERVEAADFMVTPADIKDGMLEIRCGKKSFHRFNII